MKIKVSFIASKEVKIIPILNKGFVLQAVRAKYGSTFNYHIVAKEYDKTIVVKQGEDYQMRAMSRVVVYAFPLDGDTVRVVSQIALFAAVTAFAPASLAKSPFLLGFTRGLLIYGGSLALNKLFPIDNGKQAQESLNFGDKQRNNNFAPGGAVPKIYGKVLFFPTISSKTFFSPQPYKLAQNQGIFSSFEVYADKEALIYTESYCFGRGTLLFENFFKADKEMKSEDYFLQLAGTFFKGDTQGLKIGNPFEPQGPTSRAPKLIIKETSKPFFSKPDEIKLPNPDNLLSVDDEVTFQANDNNAKSLSLIFETDSRVKTGTDYLPDPRFFLKVLERTEGSTDVTRFNEDLTNDEVSYTIRQTQRGGLPIVRLYQLKKRVDPGNRRAEYWKRGYADLFHTNGLSVNFQIKNKAGDFINLPENLYKGDNLQRENLFVKPFKDALEDFNSDKGFAHSSLVFQQNISTEELSAQVIEHENIPQPPPNSNYSLLTSYQPRYDLNLNFDLAKIGSVVKTEYGSLEYIGGKSYKLTLSHFFLTSVINRTEDKDDNIVYKGNLKPINGQLRYHNEFLTNNAEHFEFSHSTGVLEDYKTERFKDVEVKMTVTNIDFIRGVQNAETTITERGNFKLTRAFWEYAFDHTQQVKKAFPADENNLLVTQDLDGYNSNSFSAIVTNLIQVPSNISDDYSMPLPPRVEFRNAVIANNEHRNPAYICLDMLKNAGELKKIPNSGLTDATIDYVSFEIFAKACSTRGLFCSAIFETQENLQTSLDSISFVGLAKIKKILGKWTAVLSYNYGAPSKMLTPQNSSNWSFGFPQDKKYHGVKLSYLEESNAKNKRQSIAYFSSYTESTASNFFDIAVVVSLEQETAQKIANFYRDSLFNQKEQFTCEVDIKQLGLSFGQLVLVGGSPIVNSDIVSARVSKVKTKDGIKTLSFQVGIKLEQNTDYYLTVYKTTGEISDLNETFQAKFKGVVDNINKCVVSVQGVEVLVNSLAVEIQTKSGVQLFEEIAICGLSNFNFDAGDIICIKKNNTSPKPFIITDIVPKDGLNSADITLLEHTTIPQTNLDRGL